MSDDNVIRLNFYEKPILARKKGSIRCRCRRFQIDEHTRTIECSTCGRIWDPFELMLKWAQKEHSITSRINRLNEKEEEMTEKIDRLKKEEQNVKSRLKRANRKLPF